MKTKLFLFLAAVLLTIGNLNAQNRQQRSPEERAKNQSERLTEKLKLNDDQKQKVYDIVLKYAKERGTQMSSDMTREQRMEEFQKTQKKESEELKEIFTDEQKKEYDKYLEEMRERRRNDRR